jgi:hypothetical protein
MNSKVLLLCQEGEAKQAYLKEMEAAAAAVDAVASYGELVRMMRETAYQGVVIDLVTSIKAPKEEKERARQILEVFRVLQVRWDADSRIIRTMSAGKTSDVGTLAEFVKIYCEPFAPRTIRSDYRKPVNFNVLMYKGESRRDEPPERTVTINVSKNGCFLYSSEDWTAGANIRLTLNELEDKTLIAAIVRWSVKWGEAMAIPGIGVEFTNIGARQAEEFVNKYRL